jgi:hypothetical protein
MYYVPAKNQKQSFPNGQALVIEFVPNEDRISPPLQAMFAFWMLASTPGGDAYTLSDLQAMASDAGFARTNVVIAHFLHHFSHKECVSLLRKVRASLSPVGQVLAVEFVPNPDRISPSVPHLPFRCWLKRRAAMRIP